MDRVFGFARLLLATMMASVLAVCCQTEGVLAQERKICPRGVPGAPTAYIDSSTSDVVVIFTEGKQVSAGRNLLLCPGDEVRTGSTGRVSIRFDEKRTVIRLDGNSRTRILSGGTGSADISLISGVLYFISSVRTQFEVDTPYIVAGIEGTEALVAVEPVGDLAIAAVREGVVTAFDHALGRSHAQRVNAGEAAFRSANVKLQTAPIEQLKSPFKGLLIVSDSAVDWAIYYPPIFLVENAETLVLREAASLLSSGNYDRALALLNANPAAEPALAAALRTIIAVSRNQIDEAEKWSTNALAVNSRSASSHIAASYVSQARGDLETALSFAREAVALANRDPYANARLAELYMIVGDRVKALAVAEFSLSIERTPLALFVAGLARLAAWQYEVAEAYFLEAIALDSQAPLPRLGLGLNLVRQGHISAGTWEIERAVALDPRRASLRVWLGRSYSAENQSEKAAEQFQIAQHEDPEDPLSYLFAALELYAANRPVQALEELQQAGLYSDARRVLRSVAGLREDSATRGAALGRIFDVLSFDQLAINEGTKAVETAPANPGAHRFLSDAYGALPGYEIAQTSELLVSQLLSPPSNTPVQPVLAEARLGLLDTSGPSRVTFAEFAPLFESDGVTLYGSGLLGTQSTWGDEFSVTGLYRNASLSLGQYHYQTDGYLKNNDLEDNIFSAVSTIALSPEFSLYGEYRFRKSEGGDRPINFRAAEFNLDPSSELEKKIARVGFHAQPSSNSDLIGVYTWATESRTDRTLFDQLSYIVGEVEDDSHSGQLQYILDGDSLRFVGGGSAMSNRKDVLIEVEGQFEQRLDYHSSHFTTYMYAYVDMPKRVTWTLGGAVVSYDDDFSGGINTFKFLPKLGVRADITDYFTVRAAYLKNLKPDLVSEQVLEPTSVAGFNQFYDTYNGSTLDQFGGAVDLKLGKNLRIGGEVINREYSIPLLGAPDGELEERSYGGYVYATFLDDFAFSAEIVHEHAKSKNAIRDFADWRVTSVPLTLSYFSESGWFGSAGIEFVDHSFEDPGSGGEDTFNFVSATIGYRLPDNRGVISLEGQNLLDTDFSFQNRSIRYQLTLPPRYAPDLTIALRGTFSF